MSIVNEEGITHRIGALDGLRAISVAFVLLGHLRKPLHITTEPLYSYFALLATLGVHVFFVTSGYLITRILVAELQRSGTISLRRFYFRRTLRIFPPYYALLVAMLVLALLGIQQIPLADLLRAATYTSNYQPSRAVVVGHTWSLAVEEQFYLLWPAVLLALSIKRARFLLFAIVIACPLLRYLLSSHLPYEGYEIGRTFETVADALAIGCLLALTRDWLWQRSTYRRLLQSQVFVIVPLASTALWLLQSGRVGAKFLFFQPLAHVGVVLTVDALLRCSDTVGARLLSSKPFRAVGLASYSLYLWQQLFLMNPDHDFSRRMFPATLLFAAIAATLSYFAIERPSLRLRERLERLMALRSGSVESPVARSFPT